MSGFRSMALKTLGEAWDAICMTYWSSTQAYMFCEGYRKLGWHPHLRNIESWLRDHIVAFVLREYPERWGNFRGNDPIDEDGSICRPPTDEEKRIM